MTIQKSNMWKSVLILMLFCGCGSLAQKLKVSIYYESLCPDSARFLVNQLYPIYKEYGSNIDVDLVTYGKANATKELGLWEFECQHGAAECYGNKVQSCAIELYPVDVSTEFVICAMSSGNASLDANLEECATSNKIPWTALQDCVSTGQADEILVANGKRTDELIPHLINFVPTVVINDVFNNELHNLAYNDFEDTFLFLLEQVKCGFCNFNGSNSVFGSAKFVFGSTLLLLFMVKNIFV